MNYSRQQEVNCKAIFKSLTLDFKIKIRHHRRKINQLKPMIKSLSLLNKLLKEWEETGDSKNALL